MEYAIMKQGVVKQGLVKQGVVKQGVKLEQGAMDLMKMPFVKPYNKINTDGQVAALENQARIRKQGQEAAEKRAVEAALKEISS